MLYSLLIIWLGPLLDLRASSTWPTGLLLNYSTLGVDAVEENIDLNSFVKVKAPKRAIRKQCLGYSKLDSSDSQLKTPCVKFCDILSQPKFFFQSSGHVISNFFVIYSGGWSSDIIFAGH